MKSAFRHAVAAIGLGMLLGVPASWLGITAGAMMSFQGLNGNLAETASQITAGMQLGMWSAIIGRSIAGVGLVLLLVSLFVLKVRAPWVLKWGQRLMLPLLIVMPFGTLAGALMLVYFYFRRNEFVAQVSVSNQRPIVPVVATF